MQTAKLSRVVPWRGLDVHGAVEASRMNPSAARVSRRNAASTAMTVGVLVAFGVMAWHRRWLSDDGFIDLRVVQNILRGNGPVFNRGERVEAFTNPLWVALLTAACLPLRRLVVEDLLLTWASVLLGLVATLGARDGPLAALASTAST